MVGSGRTDSGVHATGQVFHSDLKELKDPDHFMHRLNSFLPPDISINAIQKVGPSAHARFDARKRSYEYMITRVKDPLLARRAYRFQRSLDLAAMEVATRKLVGERDFECFSRVKTDVDHFVCDVKEARWVSKNSRLIFRISANRFLRGMVRAIVGTLLEVGTGLRDPKNIVEVLHSGDRKLAGPAAPAEGLYLVGVRYPKSIYL